MADAWLTNGDCTKCRRKSYCSKQCKANREYEFKRQGLMFGHIECGGRADILERMKNYMHRNKDISNTLSGKMDKRIKEEMNNGR